MTFNVGDIVKISAGAYEGKLGVVKNVRNDDIDVRFAKSNNSLVVMSFPFESIAMVDD
ncbi:KOW motif-containing protein [Pseudobacteriovorax antillogorgiicola]|uniref:KOW motif-containing protein n=1 Tax=Pseudobacteriovorax antillogorgiicola TaxID=1513793 RepID=A0A1Y6C7Q0_9BACT|nr:KOW motif-containing protein [Pseudobacteriovorax antillogorgiicola]TCS51702.1 KOW motif-containing protein [Pseudobacteriovorax antillogorgiicola]SMF49213.1 KOW motif-containing protein [Pseudobacteriovorax antillogorgiicola]